VSDALAANSIPVPVVSSNVDNRSLRLNQPLNAPKSDKFTFVSLFPGTNFPGTNAWFKTPLLP
jgi:hypothetical protein